jgi:hypothetical protein
MKILRGKMKTNSRLHVKWFAQWNPEIGEALEMLPAMDEYPHELYRELLQTPCPVEKRFALVTEHRRPVSVVGLRRRGRSWEPIPQWILPGAIFPYQPGYLMPSLEAIGQDVWVGWWRWDREPPESPMIRSRDSQEVYRFDLSENIEEYWRKTGQFKTVRLRRNRCKDFQILINQPGALEWTIRNWGEKWCPKSESELPDLQDRLAAAIYLQHHDRCFVFTMLDHDLPVAGNCVMIHHKDVVALVNYRDSKYDWNGVSERLIDFSFCWAQTSGYKIFDIGGDHHYKSKWAPAGGQKWTFNICPTHLYQPKVAVRRLRSFLTNLRARIHKRTAQPDEDCQSREIG